MPSNDDDRRRRRRKLIFLLFGWLVAAGGLGVAVTDLESESPKVSQGGAPATPSGGSTAPPAPERPARPTDRPAPDNEAHAFSINGSVSQLFAPGVSRPVNLVLGNPHNFTIRVTAVTITVSPSTDKSGCSGTANLKVTKSLSVPVDVPKNATRSLQQLGVAQANWPVLTMPNLPTNQDACKNALFSLSYTGQAVKP